MVMTHEVVIAVIILQTALLTFTSMSSVSQAFLVVFISGD